MKVHPLVQSASGTVLVAATVALLLGADGLLFWPVFGTALVSALALVHSVARGGSFDSWFAPAVLVVIFSSLGLTLVEAALWTVERLPSVRVPEAWAGPPTDPREEELLLRSVTGVGRAEDDLSVRLPADVQQKIQRMQGARFLPRAWEKRKLPRKPGRGQDFYWHGVLHLQDENDMRRAGPFPARSPSRFRVLAVGDSFTYGEGVHADWSWPALLERSLGLEHDVEVLNLGQRGRSSEDIIETVRRFVPELEPDLVLYGVCLNDYLDSMVNESRIEPQVVRDVRQFFIRGSRVGQLVAERMAALFQRMGLRPSFASQITSDLDRFRPRFKRDAREMNAIVLAAGLPPIVAMVLEPRPSLGSPEHELTLAAQQDLEGAGLRVVDVEPYFHQFDGRYLGVSRWEPHPNEEAHAIFAGMFLRAILSDPEIAERLGNYDRPPR